MQNPQVLDKVTLREKFHQCGHKYTEQRQVVLDVILEHPNLHLSSDDICEFLRQKGLNIGQSTVYRTLLMLEKLNIVRKTDLDDGYTRYELSDCNDHAHHHLICMKCGGITDIEDDLLDDLEDRVCEKYHFQVKDHSLKLFGECEQCKDKASKDQISS